MADKPYFFDLALDDLTHLVTSWGMAGFRAKQVMQWVYAHGIADPAYMTNLSLEDRKILADRMIFLRSRVVRRQYATDGTQKLLLEWTHVDDVPDADASSQGLQILEPLNPDRQTECVMIPAGNAGRPYRSGPNDEARFDRRTACVSSQIGCPVGCRFCASGLGGLAVEGNLTAGQIVEQVWRLNQCLNDRQSPNTSAEPAVPNRITNVVFMGMGEPLSNFAAVTAALRTLMTPPDAGGLGISGRRITVSTVGLPAQIRRLADLDLPITLAISLHAPNDELRREIIPWASLVTIDQLVHAGRYYFDKTGREVTLEYILLAGVNDQPTHARQLAQVARRLRSNVNLIRYNQVAGLPFARPLDGDVHHFESVLRNANVNVHIRASRGRDIAAACGQLRHESSPTPVSPTDGVPHKTAQPRATNAR